jgi:hypothetical protein
MNPFEPRWYILDHERRPVRVDDALTWGRWLQEVEDNHVAHEEIGDTRVSTIFLGLDHRHSGNGPPMLFETMIFGGMLDGTRWRYSTWDDAETGHAMAVKKARAALDHAVEQHERDRDRATDTEHGGDQ